MEDVMMHFDEMALCPFMSKEEMKTKPLAISIEVSKKMAILLPNMPPLPYLPL